MDRSPALPLGTLNYRNYGIFLIMGNAVAYWELKLRVRFRVLGFRV